MSHFTVDCRIYFTDEGNAQNAYDHIKALAEHAAAHGLQVGKEVENSWGRLHECFVDENEGDVSLCEEGQVFIIRSEPAGGGEEDPEVSEWEVGEAVVAGDLRSYEGTVYICLQSHTTQEGWEPPIATSLWSVA